MTAPLAIFADWNLPLDDVRGLAQRIEGHVLPGSGVDHGVVREMKSIGKVNLGKRGSDHHDALMWDLMVRGEFFRTIWWNVYVGNNPDNVGDQVRNLAASFKPDVIGLCEAYRCRGELRKVKGYVLYQGLNVGEGADIAVLVRKDRVVLHDRVLKMLATWIGPVHNVVKRPREYRVVRLRIAKVPIRYVAAHLPTGGYDGRNSKSVKETVARLIRFAG